MAALPGKKIRQNVTTFENTATNLGAQAKADPLTNVLGGVSSNVTKSTQQAAAGANQQEKNVAQGSGQDALGKAFTVNQSAYQPQAVKAPTVAPIAQPAAPSIAKPVTIETLSALPTEYNVDTTPGKASISQQVQDNKTALSSQGATDYGTLSNAMDPITKSLQQQGQQTTDKDGNIIGSTRGVGQVGQYSDLETQAQMRDQALATQRQNSNIDALAMLLGVNYDPRTAALNSQIYGGQVAGLRGEANARNEMQKSAEGARTTGIENWLAETERGQQRVGNYTDSQRKTIDDLITSGGTSLDASGEAALTELEQNATNVKGQAKKDTQNQVVGGLNGLLEAESIREETPESFRNQLLGGLTNEEAVKRYDAQITKLGRMVDLARKQGLDKDNPAFFKTLSDSLAVSQKNKITAGTTYKPIATAQPQAKGNGVAGGLPTGKVISGAQNTLKAAGKAAQAVVKAGDDVAPLVDAAIVQPTKTVANIPSQMASIFGYGGSGKNWTNAELAKAGVQPSANKTKIAAEDKSQPAPKMTLEQALKEQGKANKKKTPKPSKGGAN
jgi:hypothetical protein